MFRPRRVLVANKRNTVIGEYVGRPSPLGNPFKMHHAFMRDEVCDLYEAWLDRKIAERDEAVCAEMNRLYRKAKRGRLYLLCHCAPMRCHAEHIALLLNAALGQGMQNGKVLSDAQLHKLDELACIAAAEAESPNSPEFDALKERVLDGLIAAKIAATRSAERSGGV